MHEEGPYRVTAPPGTYRIFATYPSGNSPGRGRIFDVVADVQVFPGLPPISSASQSTADPGSSTAASESMLSLASSEPPPGGGGGGDPDPTPCEGICPVDPIAV